MEVNDMRIAPFGPEHLDEAVSLLITTFQERPFYQYIAPDPNERREFLALNFRQRLEYSLGVSEIELAFRGLRIAGIAVWARPAGAAPLDASPPEETFPGFSAGLRERMSGFLHILIAARDQAVRQPYWSLAPIAVLPEEQGKGIASALIRKKLRDIDVSPAPCFLGTQDAVNLDIYTRYGFQKVREDPLAPGLVHYTMVRPKQASHFTGTPVAR